MSSGNILEQIIARRREEIAQQRAKTGLKSLRARAERAREGKPRQRLQARLQRDDGIHIIAEFKRASPSRGLLRREADAAAFAALYEKAGACALSVLTEPGFFRGSLEDLRQARAGSDLPILRKDFVIDPLQIEEAAAAGADAILLIAAALDDETLAHLRVLAEDDLGLDALVEVHTEEEMERAAACGAKLIGVNNRDLRTFATTVETSLRLAARAPAGATLVSESGISSSGQIAALLRSGYRGFLIGESLMQAADPEALLRALRVSAAEKPKIKVCGLTRAEDARLCGELGVDLVGLNFSPASARCLTPKDARALIDAVRPQFPALQFVGVFVEQDFAFVQNIAGELALDAIQLHGDEAPDYVRALQAPFLIKALRVGNGFSPASARAYDCDAVLLDTYSPSVRGGSGEVFDWSIAVAVKSNGQRVFLAGGLTAENVAKAIDVVRPFAIDVCSGIEDAPGRKNEEKLRRLLGALECHAQK